MRLSTYYSISKGRSEQNGLLLEGLKQINWALAAKLKIKHVFVHETSSMGAASEFYKAKLLADN